MLAALIVLWETALGLAADRAIIVLDASGSMWGQIDGRPKVEIARETLRTVPQSVPADMELGLMAYGHRRKGDQEQKAAELDRSIDVFLREGKEDLALAAQSRLNSISRLVQNYDEMLERQEAEYQSLKDARLKLEAKLTTVKQEREELQVLLDLARSKELTAQTIKSLDGLMGSGDDDIAVREVVRLNGPRARGLAKSRIAVRERARSDVRATTEGHAPGARGHVDCVEIVRDQAIANAVPIVLVTDPQAQVTHEAAIGTVDKKQLETLLARGLEEDVAVDVIVRGMLAD